MPTVYSYLRFSRPEQLRGDSLRRQLNKTEAWAKRNGYPLDKSLDLRDLGVSAYRGKNTEEGAALGHFLECIETGRVKAGDYLILENLDRLSRQKPFASLQLIQQILGAGVSLVTLDPERVYSTESVGDLGALIEMIVILSRAHDESDTKSKRLRAAWHGKRERVKTEKLTAVCPKWLQVERNEAGKIYAYKPIPERVEIVRRIFRMASDGMGTEVIGKTLNGEGVATFGRSKFWQRSYLIKTLTNRAVLGEFQPHRMEDGKRVAIGEPIPDYFPRIIEDREFYAVQAGFKERKTQAGPHGKRLANLFTGLVKDARDGSNLRMVDKGQGPTLVSGAAIEGAKGAVYVSFPYAAFEQAVLVWAWDLNLGDILPRAAVNLDEEIKKAEGRVADLDHRIKTLRTKMKTADKFEALVDLLVELETDRAEAQAKVERLKRESVTRETDALDRMKELLDRLGAATEEDAYQLRVKLRSQIKRLVNNVVVLVVQVNGDRVAFADIQLRNGERRRLAITSGKRVPIPEGLEGLDVREWRNWPKEYRKTRFNALTEEAREMMELEDSGLSRLEIAKQLGVSLSHVSRSLCRVGRAKGTKKPASHHWRMTYHPGGRGWVKQHKGERYFIGLGKLAEAYPKLVTEKTPEGSWQAANVWWERKLAELSKPRAVSRK